MGIADNLSSTKGLLSGRAWTVIDGKPQPLHNFEVREDRADDTEPGRSETRSVIPDA